MTQYSRPKPQVFVSSTFLDLEQERKEVFNALYAMQCIVAGMELFPAVDQEQFEFIKRIIDDSDYYVVLLGGRYGTPSPNGTSYTELEYDYAVSKGLRIVALLHASPTSLPGNRIDSDPAVVEKLERFRKKIKTGRLVKTWNHPSELAGHVAIAIQTAITLYPARGWVRGDTAPSEEIYAELNSIRAEREVLRGEIDSLKKELQIASARASNSAAEDIPNALSRRVNVRFGTVPAEGKPVEARELELQLGGLLKRACLSLYEPARQPDIKRTLEEWICKSQSLKAVEIEKGGMERLAYMLETLGVIRVTSELEEREVQNWGGHMVFASEGRRPLNKMKFPVVFWTVTATGREILAAPA